MKTKSRLRSSIAHAALIGCIAQPLLMVPAMAQDSGVIDLGTIYLTGERTDKTEQNTASSVAVLSGDEIGARSNDIRDALETVPNLLELGSGVAPTIRGIESQGPQEGAVAFFAGTTPRATVQVDGHYQSFYEYVNGGTGMWDVDSVEVYRGPQTTKQGANSIAGAIVVNTKDPSFTPEASGQVFVGSYNMRRASFAVSSAITPDIALRFSADYFQRDNYIDVKDPSTIGTRTDRDYETQTYRAKLLWQPAATPGLSAKLTFAHTDSNQPTSESVPFPYDGELSTDSGAGPTWHVISDAAVADLRYEFANGVTISNQLSYGQSETDRVLEEVEDGTAHIEANGWSNELRATFGDEFSTWSGAAGLFLSQNDQDDDITLVFNGNGGDSYFDNEKTSQGLYGEATWRPSDRWELTGGLRLQRDEVKRSGTYESYVFGTTHQVSYDETFDAVLPNIGIAYKPTENTTLGFTVSKGYNPGGSGLNFVTSSYYEYDKESVWTYEAYLRSSLLDDRLFVAANLFFSDYTDQQVAYGRTTYNADRAETYGLELAANYAVRDDLRLNLGLGLLNTEIREFSAVPSLVGNELDRAPDATLSLGATWDVNDKLTLGANLRHVSGYYSDVDNNEDYAIDAFTVANISASYDLTDQVELYGYVNNLFDENTPTWVRGATGSYSTRVTDPRMIGVGLRMQF